MVCQYWSSANLAVPSRDLCSSASAGGLARADAADNDFLAETTEGMDHRRSLWQERGARKQRQLGVSGRSLRRRGCCAPMAPPFQAV